MTRARDSQHDRPGAGGAGLDDAAATIAALRARIADLEAFEARRTAAEEAIRLAAAETGDQFFRALVAGIARVLGVRHACVASVDLAAPTPRARTVAYYAEGRVVDDVEYDLAGTPCATILDRGDACVYPRGVAAHFPDDRMLADLRIESYAGIPLRDAAGRTLGLLAVLDAEPLEHVESVTAALRLCAIRAGAELERRRADAALRESERKYRDLVETSTDLIWATDLEGRFTFVNRAAKSIYGYDPAEMIGRSFLDLVIKPELRAQADGVFRKMLQGSSYVQAEIEQVRRDGTPVRLLGTGIAVRDAAGKTIGATGTATDVTERRATEKALRRSEEQLRQAQKIEAIGRLAGGIAHDFNNLLLVILGFGDRLIGRLREEDPLRRDALMIRRAGERGAALTRRLLAFGRKQVFAPAELDLGAVVEGLEPLLRRLIGEDVDLRVVRARGPGRTFADRSQIEQVVMNLVLNARDALRGRGGRIEIETRDADVDEAAARASAATEIGAPAPGRYVRLAVTDTGCGMDRATLERLFEPFFTTKEVGEGTGLGLATVYGIVKQTGGTVTVRSRPGLGSTFEVYLPRREPAAAGPSTGAASSSGDLGSAAEIIRPRSIGLGAPAPTSATILLVEDDDMVRALAREMLEEWGYTVVEAHDGEDALAQAERRPGKIDLLVSDVIMPRLGGPELFRRLAAARPGLRALFMSAYAGGAAAGGASPLDPGANFIQKPFAAEAFAKRVRDALES